MNRWDQPQRPGVLAPVRRAVRRVRVAGGDAWHNRRGRVQSKRILIVRHQRNNWTYNDHFLRWLRTHVPAAAALFELRRVDCRIDDWGRYALLVPWLQDPVRERFPDVYTRVKRMEDACDARGIPIVNRVDALSNAIKSRAVQLMRAAGIRVPTIVAISDPAAFRKQPTLALPFLIREDDRHGSQMTLVEYEAQLAKLPLETLRNPIAVEFVDTRSADGCYRKFRHVVLGHTGLPRHLRRSTSWLVSRDSRMLDPQSRAEQRQFVAQPDPRSALFQRARRALDLDVVAFDYGFDRAGAIVVFEPNPFGVHWYPHEPVDDTHPEFEFMSVFYAEFLRYHLDRAGLEVSIPAFGDRFPGVVVRGAA